MNFLTILEKIKFQERVSTDAEIAKVLGMTRENFYSHKKRSSIPYEKIIEYCRKKKLSLDWMFLDDQNPEGSNISKLGVEEGNYFLIPLFNMGQVRDPLWDKEIIIGHLPFSSDWIKEELRLPSEELIVMIMQGDSMEPRIKEGDFFMVHVKAPETLQGGIYVLQNNGTSAVRRIQNMSDGSINLIAQNDNYTPERIAKEAKNQLKIAGKVVWIGNTL